MAKAAFYLLFFISLILSACQKTGKDVINTYYQQGKLNGAVLWVKNDSILCDTISGYLDFKKKIPFEQQTQFYIASLTKPITAIGIMILQQRGTLAYEEKVSKYIAELPKYAQNITINQLLTHTSGIKDYDDIINPKTVTLTNDEVMRWLNRQDSLNFKPNRKFEYSNSGYVLLAKIIENISGQTYKEFCQENIFEPLRMEHTLVFDERSPLIKSRAIGFNKDKQLDDYIQFTTGDAGIYSTTEDLFKLDKALRNDSFLSANNKELMYQAQPLSNGKRNAYGFGWFLTEENIAQHEGELFGFRSLFWRDLKNNNTLIVLTNQGDAFSAQGFLKDMKKIMD